MSPSMGTGLQQLTPDTYRLSRVDGAGRYADSAAMKSAIIEEANTFAKQQGKVAIPISGQDETLRGHLLTAEYQFRLATPGAPAAAPVTPVSPPAAAAGPASPAATVAPAAAVVPAAATTGVVATAAVAAAPPAADPKPSFYDELIMLEDLRRRGILTDAEFQALKGKLIATK